MDTTLDEMKKSFSYKDIATKLLNDKLLLTALELHTELVEQGKELRILRDFFSNPLNFESHQEGSVLISRSGSQATLDSLDMTRYSEDGAADDKVAVLEFELRKARETINSLRNNLTVAAESESNKPSNKVSVQAIKPHEKRALNFLINEYLLMYGYKLTSITFADENEDQDFEDWDDVGLNIAKPSNLLTIFREGLKRSCYECLTAGTQTDTGQDSEKVVDLMATIQNLEWKITNLEVKISELETLNVSLKKQSESNAQKNLCATPGSNSPECFEIIDRTSVTKARDSIIMEDNVSNNSLNVNDWTNVTVQERTDECSRRGQQNALANATEDPFKKALFAKCYVTLPSKSDNPVLDSIINGDVTDVKLMRTFSSSLARVVPNILLNKREEVIPLLISAVLLSNSSQDRDKLLHLLLNLKKRPTDEERLMIIAGIIGIAKHASLGLVENEILPQCWEQLTDRHPELRVVVAECCGALVPYVSSPIRNSLLLSILQQLLEDNQDAVRKAVVRALPLVVALCDDADKYIQCEQLAFLALADRFDKVANLTIDVLFPAVAKRALDFGRLQTDLFKSLLHKLHDAFKNTENCRGASYTDRVLRILRTIEKVLPFLLVHCVRNDKVIGRVSGEMAAEIRPDLLDLCCDITNPKNIYESDLDVGAILYEFDRLITENGNVSWPELDWIVDIMLPDLLNSLHYIPANNFELLNSFVELFYKISVLFGKNFAHSKIRPFFSSRVHNLEDVQWVPSFNVIPVYLVSVLSYCDSGDEIASALKRFLCALPVCGTPSDCLVIAVEQLCIRGRREVVVSCLWDSVVHQSPLVRAAAATLFSAIVAHCDDNVLTSKITPAIVTLASDSDILVRTAAIPALGTLITDCDCDEVHQKAFMQIQSYLADNTLRDNHSLLRQLVVTLGIISNRCPQPFRQDVILPQLSAFSLYMSQMANSTRKVDMAMALMEAFSHVIFFQQNRNNMGTAILPGLRCLEAVVAENPSLASHKVTVATMVKEFDKGEQQPPSVAVSQQIMRQRMSRMFGRNPNLPTLFKKK